MFDFKFNWDPSIELGLPTIDTQHKELFRIGRSIEQIILTNFIGVDNKQLLQIVCEVRDYITYHFYEEEKFMLECNYPDFLVHKKYHDSFKKKINAINCNDLHDSIKSLKELLVKWVFQHMLVEDHAIKPYIK